MRTAFSLATINAAILACGVLTVAGVGPVAAARLVPAGPDGPGGGVTAQAGEQSPSAAPSAAASAVPTPTPSARPTAVPSPAAPSAVAAPARPAATPRPAPVTRQVARTGWAPYATAGPVTLHFPGDVVEVVGLHQSGHDGAQPQLPVKGPARVGLMGSRGRDTHGQGAADIVVDPRQEVRAPVTGTVLRAGTYTLYCDHVDQYLVVEPDARPGWQVKMLHFEGLTVGKGDRVEAGVTVVGSGGRVLPFASQVDKHTVAPHWPHLHVEVVDPSVPDRPSGGSCD